jgi:hypothetical protein
MFICYRRSCLDFFIGSPKVIDLAVFNDWLADAPSYMGASLVQDRDLNQYSSSLSSTSRHLPCSHQLCNQNSSCKGSKDPCPYIGKYASDDTSSSGFLIEDKLHLASNNATKNSVQASIIFGYVRFCITFSLSFGSFRVLLCWERLYKQWVWFASVRKIISLMIAVAVGNKVETF